MKSARGTCNARAAGEARGAGSIEGFGRGVAPHPHGRCAVRHCWAGGRSRGGGGCVEGGAEGARLRGLRRGLRHLLPCSRGRRVEGGGLPPSDRCLRQCAAPRDQCFDLIAAAKKSRAAAERRGVPPLPMRATGAPRGRHHGLTRAARAPHFGGWANAWSVQLSSVETTVYSPMCFVRTTQDSYYLILVHV